MTIPKALPPGVNHLAASKRVAAQVDGAANDAIDNHTGPRPAGPKRVLTAEIPVKSLHSVTGK
jgi:hypothetical protein